MFAFIQDTLSIAKDSLFTTESIPDDAELFQLIQKLGIAILIGALVGLEREFSKPKNEKIFAGIRTFPLISIIGFLAALVSTLTDFWVYIAIFIGFSAILTASHFLMAKEGNTGGTSEMAIVTVFILGSLVFWNFIILAAVIAVIIAAFLSLKMELHTFVGKISKKDIYATIKLAIISVIILPLLPDRTFGPLDVLNPQMIWLMVIFISGISFVGYVLIKTVGKEKGIPITGLMGGMISSTAVAFSFSRKSKKNNMLGADLAVGIILASTIMFPRVFIVVFVLNSSLIPQLWLPLLIFTMVSLAVSWIISKKFLKKTEEDFEIKNPFELKSALIFGLIFGAVIFIAKAAQVYLGDAGVYSASALAGLTSVDAIVVSLAKLSGNGFGEKTVIAAIIIALISNTIVKAVIAAYLGSKELKKFTFIGLGIVAAAASIYLGIYLIKG